MKKVKLQKPNMEVVEALLERLKEDICISSKTFKNIFIDARQEGSHPIPKFYGPWSSGTIHIPKNWANILTYMEQNDLMETSHNNAGLIIYSATRKTVYNKMKNLLK